MVRWTFGHWRRRRRPRRLWIRWRSFETMKNSCSFAVRNLCATQNALNRLWAWFVCVLFVLCVIFCDRTMAFVIFFFYICAFFTTFIVLLFAWFYGIILCNVVRLHSLDFHTFAVSRCAFELISARWVCFFSFVCCCDFCFFFRTLHIGFFHIYILQMTYELYAHMYNHSHRDF